MNRQTHRDVDELLRAIAHPQRRAILERLDEERECGRGELTLRELASALDDGQRVAIACRHEHVPKLRDADVLDGTAGDPIAPGPAFEYAITVLDCVCEC